VRLLRIATYPVASGGYWAVQCENKFSTVRVMCDNIGDVICATLEDLMSYNAGSFSQIPSPCPMTKPYPIHPFNSPLPSNERLTSKPFSSTYFTMSLQKTGESTSTSRV
jgi:hypothetical protein